MAQGLYNCITDERNDMDYCIDDADILNKYNEILKSNVSIIRTWISIYNTDRNRINSRIGNKFYSKCMFHNHNTFDTPVCIDENRKGFYCYGCRRGGTIVTLVYEIFNHAYDISIEDSIEIVHAFITNNIDGLSKEQLEILKLAFEHYNSPEADKYIEESKQKTEKFDQRIKNYIEKNNSNLDDVEYISKRLCCSKNYVKRFMTN